MAHGTETLAPHVVGRTDQQRVGPTDSDVDLHWVPQAVSTASGSGDPLEGRVHGTAGARSLASVLASVPWTGFSWVFGCQIYMNETLSYYYSIASCSLHSNARSYVRSFLLRS